MASRCTHVAAKNITSLFLCLCSIPWYICTTLKETEIITLETKMLQLRNTLAELQDFLDAFNSRVSQKKNL